MTTNELIRMVADRMNEDEAEAAVDFIGKLDQDDLEYYARTGIDGLIRCIRGEYVDYTKGTSLHLYDKRY